MTSFRVFNSKKQRGLVMVLISGVVYGLQPLMVAYGYEQGANAPLIVAGRYGAVALMLLPFVQPASKPVAVSLIVYA